MKWFALLALLWASLAQAATVNVASLGIPTNSPANITQPLQTVINNQPNGTTFYFPAGIYNFCDLAITNRQDLTFTGDGPTTILRYCNVPVGYTRMLTVKGSQRITFKFLTFDNRHILSYGGVNVVESSWIKFLNNSFVDSDPRPPGSTDRYGLVFGKGLIPSTDITIQQNVFDYVNLEVDHSQRVKIDLNTFYHIHSVAAIGGFSIADNAILTDYSVTRNTIYDPGDHGRGYGIVFNLDRPSTCNGLFERITIKDNHIHRLTSTGYNIRIGTPNTAQPTVGNVFRHFLIANNTVHYHNGIVEYPTLVIHRNNSLVIEDIVSTGNVEVLE